MPRKWKRNLQLTPWAERRGGVLRQGHRVEVFSAIWVRQGPGYSLVSERGFIARLGPHTAHAGEAVAAVRAVVRKAGQDGLQGVTHPCQERHPLASWVRRRRTATSISDKVSVAPTRMSRLDLAKRGSS